MLDTELLPKISINPLKFVLVETDENADENLEEDESVGEKINTKGLESSAKEITLILAPNLADGPDPKLHYHTELWQTHEGEPEMTLTKQQHHLLKPKKNI